METVGQQKLWSFADRGEKAAPMTCGAVRNADARHVVSFMDLAKRVAELQFMNRDLVLMFRGQSCDHRNKSGNTSLKPTIFRAKTTNKVPSEKTLAAKYALLRRAESALIDSYRAGGTPGSQRLRRQQILRWSILQHYGVCDTPLLDVSHSLRIAASFATLDADNEAFVLVLGVPNLSGAVTANADAGLQIIRLSSVCPPSAMRPHIREGYLLGEYPEMASVDQKQNYKHYEIDFGRRLVAKFRFKPIDFWNASKDFPQVMRGALYPNEDPLLDLTKAIRSNLNGSS
jgi:hypothetical protein